MHEGETTLKMLFVCFRLVDDRQILAVWKLSCVSFRRRDDVRQCSAEGEAAAESGEVMIQAQAMFWFQDRRTAANGGPL